MCTRTLSLRKQWKMVYTLARNKSSTLLHFVNGLLLKTLGSSRLQCFTCFEFPTTLNKCRSPTIQTCPAKAAKQCFWKSFQLKNGAKGYSTGCASENACKTSSKCHTLQMSFPDMQSCDVKCCSSNFCNFGSPPTDRGNHATIYNAWLLAVVILSYILY